MSATPELDHGPPGKALTIGAVCKQLEREFPDISISKIRYLEDQKLLTPQRTAGGYRLFAPGDVARLRTILRLQRDEFLPLRVIRQELAAGRAEQDELAKGTKSPEARTLRGWPLWAKIIRGTVPSLALIFLVLGKTCSTGSFELEDTLSPMVISHPPERVSNSRTVPSYEPVRTR